MLPRARVRLRRTKYHGRKHKYEFLHPFRAFDLATALLIVAITLIALWTFRDYAVSNDEGLQHHYGQLILEYYRSGMTDETVFGFRDLYLYGGLFDIVSVRLGEIFASFDVYDIRHILCALIGVAGIAATAATARTISGSRAGFIAAVALAVCGCWYGTMFNHTKDIPLAAGMIGAIYMLIRIMRRTAASALRRRSAVRLADGMRSRHSRSRAAAGILRWFCGAACDAATAAKEIGGRPAEFIMRSIAVSLPRFYRRLSDHDRGLAVGGAGAAQSHSRPVRVCRVSETHRNTA